MFVKRINAFPMGDNRRSNSYALDASYRKEATTIQSSVFTVRL